MIDIIKEKKKPSFGQKINAGIGRGLEIGNELMGEYQKEQLYKKENEAIKKQTGQDLSDIRDTGMRHMLMADQLTKGKNNNIAESTHDKDYSPYNLEKVKSEKGVKSGSISSKDNKATDRMIEEVEKRRTRPVMDLDQMIESANEKAKLKTQQGVPTTFEQEFDTISKLNAAAQVENENIKRQQQEYGQRAVNKISKVMENPNDEIISLFQKKGENAYSEGKTEGEIEAETAIEARKFKNSIANISNGISALSSKPFDKIQKDLEVKLQPLLKEGLYDTARNLLDEKGFYPEQIESTISKLGENATKELASFPKMERPSKSWWESVTEPLDYSSGQPQRKKQPFLPEQQEIIKDNIKNVLTKDPSTNLVLLRQAYADKNIDWDDFKDTLNDLMLNGDIKLNDDQFNQLEVLEQPPLNGLEKILKNLRII